MLVVEFVDNTTLEANSYEESDQGVKLYGKNETFLAFAPVRSIRYLYESSASQTPPTTGSQEKKGDGGGTGVKSSTFVVEFAHGTQLGVESYETSDRGLKLYGKNETLLAYAPLSSIRYMQRTSVPTPDEKETKQTGFTLELTDDTTFQGKTYGLSDQGVKLYGKNETLIAYVPHGNVRYMHRKSAAKPTPDDKESKLTGFVVELTDDTTFEAYTYEQSDQGLKFHDRKEKVIAYAPNSSIRYMYDASASQTPGSGSGSSGSTE